MAYTTLNLITDVLLDMGVIADQETPTASQSVGALTKLNDMIESWNIDPLKLYGATEYVIPFVANQAEYTIGVGGNLNVARPDSINRAYVRNMSQPVNNRQDLPLVILTDQEWADIPVKEMSGTFPYAVWFNMTYPLITAHVTPVPNQTNYSLVFWDNNANATLALNTVLSFPPGYKRPIKSNLFIELAASYQIEVPSSVALIAQSSKMAIDRHNLEINELQTSDTLRYNILSNTFTEYQGY
jgi:hypothetical protein